MWTRTIRFDRAGLLYKIFVLRVRLDVISLLRVHETLAALIWKAALKLSLCMCTRMPGDNPSMMQIQDKDSTIEFYPPAPTFNSPPREKKFWIRACYFC